MEKENFDINKYLLINSRSLKDYITLIRTNLKTFLGIFLVIVTIAVIYALASENIYKSTVTIRINTHRQSILESQALPELGGSINDRFIANEIEIITNYDSRERYARALLDSFYRTNDKSLFSRLIENDEVNPKIHRSLKGITELLKKIISAEQMSGLDMIEITAESPSPYEAALIANTCADQYKKLNLENNRGQLTTIRKFLEEQSRQKARELNKAEEDLKNFQQRGGIVALDAQSNALINQLASLDAQRDAAKVELLTSNEVLTQYKNEISSKDPQLADYLESQASQTYIDALQKQLAELQMNKDLALSNKNTSVDVSSKIQQYDKKITELKQKLNTVINDIKVGAYSSSPEQIRDLSQKLIEEKINNNALLIKYNELQQIITSYEKSFNKLPKKSIEFAQYQRKRESMQQLYLLVEQKYQEASINELSQPGNATIIGKGRVPDRPAKPNRILILIVGVLFGLSVACGFILIRDYFDETLKTPDDIEQKNINLLAWVPHLNNTGQDDYIKHELDKSGQSEIILQESLKSLRVRIQFYGANRTSPFKTILVTSPAAGEGKTMLSVNLATSYVKAKKKTLLIDCDLIKPRIHSIMGIERVPGLTDYLIERTPLDEIINTCQVNGLDYITAGTFYEDTDQVLDSEAMRIFLLEMEDLYDIVILDSAPIIPVVDSQILARWVDTSVLIVSADKTEVNLMTNAVELFKKDDLPLLGVVFNNFRYNNGYHYYNKYYYNYSSNGNGQSKNKVII